MTAGSARARSRASYHPGGPERADQAVPSGAFKKVKRNRGSGLRPCTTDLVDIAHRSCTRQHRRTVEARRHATQSWWERLCWRSWNRGCWRNPFCGGGSTARSRGRALFVREEAAERVRRALGRWKAGLPRKARPRSCPAVVVSGGAAARFGCGVSWDPCSQADAGIPAGSLPLNTVAVAGAKPRAWDCGGYSRVLPTRLEP